MAPSQAQRIDLWLWHCRFAPTRSRASDMVRAGKVRINKVKAARPSAAVRPGDVLTLAMPAGVRVVRITGLSPRRLGAPLAAALYSELTEAGA